MDLVRVEHEIRWLETRLVNLDNKLQNKPSAVKEIAEVKHQLRKHELDLAYNSADWEKYAMWDLLSS